MSYVSKRYVPLSASWGQASRATIKKVRDATSTNSLSVLLEPFEPATRVISHNDCFK